MKHVCVLGGGISGLSLAHFLRRALGPAARITVLEAASRAGGWLETVDAGGGFIFERGPRSFRPSMDGVELLRLIEDLNLDGGAIAPAPQGAQRWLWLDGALCPMPGTLLGAIKSPMMRPALRGAAREVFVPAKDDEEDESVASFITRRFGSDVSRRFIDPLMSGIYAGDISKLSAESCLMGGRMVKFERDSGSIVRHMLRQALTTSQKSAKAARPPDAAGEGDSAFVRRMSREVAVSFERGMQTLVDSLEKQLASDPNTELRTATAVRSLRMKPAVGDAKACRGARVVVVPKDGAEERLDADHVFSTIPAPVLADALAPQSDAAIEGVAAECERECEIASLRRSLLDIDHSTVAVLNLGYDEGVLPYSGFGFLVPSSENERVLGATWESSTFPQQNARPWHTRITFMAGGAAPSSPRVVDMSETELIELGVTAAARHLGIERTPTVAVAGIARDSIPQYYVGHEQRAAGIVAAAAQCLPAVTLLGNWLGGIGVSNCVSNAKLAADRYADIVDMAE